MPPLTEQVGQGLIYASGAGIVLGLVAGRRPGWAPVALLAFAAGAAGWFLLPGGWPFGLLSAGYCLVLAWYGVRRRRARR